MHLNLSIQEAKTGQNLAVIGQSPHTCVHMQTHEYKYTDMKNQGLSIEIRGLQTHSQSLNFIFHRLVITKFPWN